jgi:uncharacterized protein DUF6448
MKEKLLLIVFFLALMSLNALGHCDTRNGPVVKAASEALRTGNINYVLIWVLKKDETEVKEAFRQTLEIRKLNPTFQKWADNYFFETVVRIHRLGEGEPYTGIKDPVVPEKTVLAVDSAVERQADEQILLLLEATLQKSLKDKFYGVLAKKHYEPDNVEAGRVFIEKYIDLLHYVENVYAVLNTGQLYQAGKELNAEVYVEKNDNVAVNQKVGGTDQATGSLSKIAVFVIFAGLALIILIQVLVSHRKRNQKTISLPRRYRNNIEHTREKSGFIGN